MSSVGSTTDASAAAWEQATIADAEAYAQAQADAAAEARDAAERNAAAGNPSSDGVEPPDAHQRALDEFYKNDPNRPPSTLPGSGGSDGGGPVSVQLTPEEAKALSDAGVKVTPDGKGGYLLDAPPEAVTVTEQAPPDAIPRPSTDGNTPVNDPTPPPPTPDSKPTQEAKPVEEATKPEETPAAKTKHPVKGIEKLQNLDPEFRKKAEQFIEKMQEKGWKMRVVWAKRTQEENDALVERGTASKTSKHLDGKGVDLVNRENPYPDDPDDPYYKDMEATAKEVGVT
jgi:flagellum-specific peptidoglycan hydrolase FlgJ